MDANAIARELVAEITDAVHRRFHPRSGVLVPPRLNGRRPVVGQKIGERVMDRADELLETEVEAWPPKLDPEIFMDLVAEGGRWYIEWMVESATSCLTDGQQDAPPS